MPADNVFLGHIKVKVGPVTTNFHGRARMEDVDRTARTVRIIGEVTPERVDIVRAATKIVEGVLAKTRAFQYLAILHEDRVTGIRNKKREFGYQIEVRCWDSTDAVTGSPTHLGWPTLETLAQRITRGVPGVVSVTYNITRKPPSTIEAV